MISNVNVSLCQASGVRDTNLIHLKGIVLPKMKILSSFTHPQVVPNLYECLCSAEHKGRYSEECGKQSSSGAYYLHSIYIFPTMEVNGAPKQPHSVIYLYADKPSNLVCKLQNLHAWNKPQEKSQWIYGHCEEHQLLWVLHRTQQMRSHYWNFALVIVNSVVYEAQLTKKSLPKQAVSVGQRCKYAWTTWTCWENCVGESFGHTLF